MSSAEIERYEERGFFLTIPFPEEDDSTLLYIADQDFETLKELIEEPETEWTEIRDELQELIDHSGHEAEHTFNEQLIQELAQVIDHQTRPENTSIDDPFEGDRPSSE